jgi:elongation factor P
LVVLVFWWVGGGVWVLVGFGVLWWVVEFYGTEPVGIELPQTVDLKVLETVPGIKGATASNQVKPATLETGLVVSVPPFINTGDVIRVSTETGEYLARA